VYHIQSHEQAVYLTAALITTFAKRFQALGVRLVVVNLPYRGFGEGPAARREGEFVLQRARDAQIATLEPDFPLGADGRLDVGDFMISKNDYHPNGRYNRVLTAQILDFLRANHIVTP
jgi:hypothetical protein